MFITWGGLTGVVSGMNKAGLTITLNSAKSDVPTTAYTPVSIVARNILQYCSTIDEAYSMAQKFKTFVSESFLIASAKENRAAIIEKSPDTTALFEVVKSEIIATNHFQSAAFKNNPLNIENIKESASMYRMQRMQELVNKKDSLNELDVAAILRDQKGLKNRNIGLCNEKAVNQLIAHHSIIFKPQKMQVWVSTYPFQLGKYICYDLNKAFSDSANYKSIIHIDSLTIPEDVFLQTQEYKNSQFYRKGVEKINLSIKNNQELKETYLQDFINSNPQFFHVYKTVGDYYASRNEKLKAIKIYEKAFDCEFPRRIDQTDIENRISALKEQ
jgi:tetratricopeptide (TPR) repeat protein